MASQAPGQLDFIANISLLFGEVPYEERFSAAAAAGFQGVETWWPFASATPERREVDELVRAVERSGVPLVGLNLYAGDFARGERGILCSPTRRDEFEDGLKTATRIASATGCRVFNALYGQRDRSGSESDEDATALANLALAAEQLSSYGVVLIEPLTKGTAGAYPIETAQDAISTVVAARAFSNRDNIALLFDTFHLHNNGDDLFDVIDTHGSYISHVQVADSPGRHQPGTGVIPVGEVIGRLWESGYRGAISCEYQPGGPTPLTLDWIGETPHVRLTPAAER
jgi:hydroxypyruvate isomerase